MTDYKLPELPEPYYTIRISSPKVPVYTAAQLRAYAIAAIQQQAGHGGAVTEPWGWAWQDGSDAGVLTLRQDYEQHKRAYPRMTFTPLYAAPPSIKKD